MPAEGGAPLHAMRARCILPFEFLVKLPTASSSYVSTTKRFLAAKIKKVSMWQLDRAATKPSSGFTRSGSPLYSGSLDAGRLTPLPVPMTWSRFDVARRDSLRGPRRCAVARPLCLPRRGHLPVARPDRLGAQQWGAGLRNHGRGTRRGRRRVELLRPRAPVGHTGAHGRVFRRRCAHRRPRSRHGPACGAVLLALTALVTAADFERERRNVTLEERAVAMLRAPLV